MFRIYILYSICYCQVIYSKEYIFNDGIIERGQTKVGTGVLNLYNRWYTKGTGLGGMHALIILHVSGENKGVEGKGSGLG